MNTPPDESKPQWARLLEDEVRSFERDGRSFAQRVLEQRESIPFRTTDAGPRRFWLNAAVWSSLAAGVALAILLTQRRGAPPHTGQPSPVTVLLRDPVVQFALQPGRLPEAIQRTTTLVNPQQVIDLLGDRTFQLPDPRMFTQPQVSHEDPS